MFIGICDDSSLDRDIIADFLSNILVKRVLNTELTYMKTAQT